MSKSLGNVIDPIEMIDRVRRRRAAVLAGALGDRRQQDIPLSRGVDRGGAATSRTRSGTRRGWCSAPTRAASPQLPPAERLTAPDRWLLSRHEACLAEVDAALDAYRFADAAQAVLPVPVVRVLRLGPGDGEGAARRRGRRSPGRRERARVGAGADASAAASGHAVRHRGDLAAVRDRAVDLDRGLAGGSVRTTVDADAEAAFGLVQDIVSAVRQFRSRHGISPAVKFEAPAAVPAWGRAVRGVARGADPAPGGRHAVRRRGSGSRSSPRGGSR